LKKPALKKHRCAAPSAWLLLIACGTSPPRVPQADKPRDEPGAAGSDAAARVLADARTAMGGEARLVAIKTFIVTGRTRQVRGDNLVPIEFEIQAELPDKFARRDEFPAQDAGPTVTGFNGERYLQSPAPQPPPARPGGPPPPTPQQLEAAARVQLAGARQEFARLMLGLFAASYPSHPLTFGYVGQAEAPQGRADVLDVKGPGDFVARLFIDGKTHLPVMLSWQGRPAPGSWPRSRWTTAGRSTSRRSARRRSASCWCRAGWWSAAGREQALLRGVPVIRRAAAAHPRSSRGGRRHDGGNDFRSVPDQRAR
jgi:hypothetical protein